MNSAAPQFSKILIIGSCLLLALAGRSETIEEARQRFAKERAPLPVHGLYEDFRGVLLAPAATLSNDARQKFQASARKANLRVAVIAEREASKSDSPSGLHDNLLFLPVPKYAAERLSVPDLEEASQEVLRRGVNTSFDANSPSNFLTHFLAREFTEPLVREALATGHFYVADDWLCDPTGFMFGAMNNQGVFIAGDELPTLSKTRVMAVTPTPAKLRLFRDDEMVKETFGTNITFDAKEKRQLSP